VDAAHVGGDSEAVSHPQAYHTSCRQGLGGHAGFQFNAASPGISSEFLARLASAHVGYHTPRDSPREPTVEELQTFPVALKCRAVDGTPVISQTVYVGREFRGRDGEPDTGRFGNYFSHIVLADPNATEPFDGLLAIELWRASHWCSSESEKPQLPELGPLQPGRCDLEWALGQLGGARKAWLGAVLDGALAAIGGGPRVVLVEPDVERAAAWVAWISYALPADLARTLTFTTFDGQPRHAQDVHLCLATPSCDLGFAEHELGREVLLLDPRATEPPEPGLLYAVVAATLAQDGPEAIAAAVARANVGSVQRRGAQLAVLGGQVGRAREEHVPSILELVAQLAEQGKWELALKTARELPVQANSEQTLRGWWMVHTSAREAVAAPARELADQALKRLIAQIPDLPEDLPAVSCESPTSPSPGLLASWLETVDDSQRGAVRATLLHGGLRLGLVGCNVALDRRVANAIGDAIDTPEMAATLTLLAGEQRHAEIVEEVIARLAREAFTDERALPRLREILADPALGDTTRRLAARAGDFDERAVWERLRVEADPSVLSEALATLVPIAEQAGRSSEVKRAFGPAGPISVEDYAELLRAFAHANLGAPEADIDATLAALRQVPLTDVPRGCDLVNLLRLTAPRRRLRETPVFLVWMAVCSPPRSNFDEWCGWVAGAVAAPAEELPEERYRELRELAAAVAVASLYFPPAQDPRAQRHGVESPGSQPERPYDPMADYVAGIRTLARAFGQSWPEAASLALQHELSKGRDKARFGAAAFLRWRVLPAETGDLIETALPWAIETLSPRRIQAIEALLSDRQQAEWARWLERHPPRPRVSGAVSRLLHRDGRRA
jgi:hypothetical protein